ncbi:hypothetical protein ACNOYE_09725 [Nannocystaceae bacterium ST9]
MSVMLAAIHRWGGILVAPRRTLEALRASPRGLGRFDGWWLMGLYVLGSQIERLTAALAKFEVLGSFAMLFNALAIALLAPVLVALLVEGLVGAERARLRNLPIAALVVVATIGTLLRQLHVVVPGPTYLPEMLGTLWAAGLALWIRKTQPTDPEERPS